MTVAGTCRHMPRRLPAFSCRFYESVERERGFGLRFVERLLDVRCWGKNDLPGDAEAPVCEVPVLAQVVGKAWGEARFRGGEGVDRRRS